jgi:hypothetical protein
VVGGWAGVRAGLSPKAWRRWPGGGRSVVGVWGRQARKVCHREVWARLVVRVACLDRWSCFNRPKVTLEGRPRRYIRRQFGLSVVSFFISVVYRLQRNMARHLEKPFRSVALEQEC